MKTVGNVQTTVPLSKAPTVVVLQDGKVVQTTSYADSTVVNNQLVDGAATGTTLAPASGYVLDASGIARSAAGQSAKVASQSDNSVHTYTAQGGTHAFFQGTYYKTVDQANAAQTAWANVVTGTSTTTTYALDASNQIMKTVTVTTTYQGKSATDAATTTIVATAADIVNVMTDSKRTVTTTQRLIGVDNVGSPVYAAPTTVQTANAGYQLVNGVARSTAGQDAKALSSQPNNNDIVQYTSAGGNTHFFFHGQYFATMGQAKAGYDTWYATQIQTRVVEYKGKTFTVTANPSVIDTLIAEEKDKIDAAIAKAEADAKRAKEDRKDRMTKQAAGTAILGNVLAEQLINPMIKDHGSVGVSVGGSADEPRARVGFSTKADENGVSLNVSTDGHSGPSVGVSKELFREGYFSAGASAGMGDSGAYAGLSATIAKDGYGVFCWHLWPSRCGGWCNNPVGASTCCSQPRGLYA